MRSTPIAQLVTFLLLLIILASSATCPVICVGETSADFDQLVISLQQSSDHEHSSDGSHGVTPYEHDHICVSCPCHAPLISLSPLPLYAPAVASFTANEPHFTLPEVYLSKFIPPQLSA